MIAAKTFYELNNQELYQILRLRSEGTVEEMKEFRNKLIANLLILGGIMVGVTVAFSKLLPLIGFFKNLYFQ